MQPVYACIRFLLITEAESFGCKVEPCFRDLLLGVERYAYTQALQISDPRAMPRSCGLNMRSRRKWCDNLGIWDNEQMTFSILLLGAWHPTIAQVVLSLC